MRTPKTFIPAKKKVAKIGKDLLDLRGSVSSDDLENILQGYERFLHGGEGDDCIFLDYCYAEEILSNMKWSQNELQPFCDKLVDYETDLSFHCTGSFLSVLVNKVIEEAKRIRLKLPNIGWQLDYMGSHLYEGVLIIKGDLGDYTGENMYGGKLIVEGSIGHNTGYGMMGGEIRAEGIGSISLLFERGRIYNRGKKIRG